MSTKLWLFEALDTLFFRDGTPFNMGEPDAKGLSSTFPPPMTTLQGAIRAALAIGHGWQKGREWPRETLGTHNGIGELRLKGPYLVQIKDERFLFPFPASVVMDQENNYHYLIPDKTEVATDLSRDSKLTGDLQVEDVKRIADSWLTVKGLEKILSGKQPGANDVVKSTELWSMEPRVGIKIDRTSRTVKDGLYFTRHARPEHDLRIAVLVSGIADEWYRNLPSFIPLGGEGKMAAITIKDKTEILPACPEICPQDGKIQFTVILNTPGHFGSLQGSDGSLMEATANAVRFGPLPELGACVTACIPKVNQVGGWDIEKRRPRPLRPELVPGSTWFYELDAERSPEVLALHGQMVGEDNEYGCGQVLIGKWGN